MLIRFLAFIAILLFSIPRLAGQGAGTPSRPKVGLVLGGGGARGLAHIGVLEWMEKHRIPIDYIAGTSMGGIIGGLYAIGMRPPQLRELTATIDWEQALGGGAPYEQLLLRRKQDNRDFPGVQLGWDNGLRLRAGLNGGHFVSLILDRAALPYWQVRDFDELPIPFRCVAADLLTAKTVVLSDGPIGDALRATMGIPGIFTPVERGGALLVDGGLLNNLPTDVVKNMGADVIIAVNVGTALRNRQDLQSLIGILDQATSLATAVGVRKNLGLADVVITPDLGKYTAASFQATEPLARAGYAAAERMQSELSRLQLGVQEWERYRDNLAARVRREVPVLRSLVVQEPAADAANAIREQLTSHRGAPLNADALEQDLTKILGWGRYASVNYDLRPSSAPLRSPELVVRPEPLVHGAAIIRLGLAVQGAHNQQVEVNLRARNTFFDIGGYGSEMRVDASIGTTLLYGMEYYRPIGKSKFFIAPRAFAVRTTANVSPSKDNLANYRRSSAGAGVDLGYGVLSQSDELRAGYEIRYDDASVVIGNPSLPSFSGTTNVLSLQWLHDRQDSATFPRRGLPSTLRGSWFLNSATSHRDFPQAELTGSFFQPVSERGSVLLTAASGTTFNRTAPLGQEFALGGPLRLSSYGLYELAGSSYALAGGGYLHAIGGNGLAKFYAIGVVQAARVFRPISNDRSGLDVTSAVIADTYIGPITLGFAMGDGGNRKGFVSIGRIF